MKKKRNGALFASFVLFVTPISVNANIFENAVKVVSDGVRVVTQPAKDIVDGAKELVTEGKCGGAICDTVEVVTQPAKDIAKGAEQLATEGECSGAICDTVEVLTQPAKDIVDGAIQLATEGECSGLVCDGADHLSGEAEKIVKKTFKEIENGAKDLESLLTKGECSGDICEAVEAVADMTEAQLIDQVQVLHETTERLASGKPLDAVWHLAADSLNHAQENAAEAAIKSSVLRSVAQIAASTYGGPYGAAGFSAWMTYHQSGGNFEAALKAGVIAGLTSEAMSAINQGKSGLPDIVKGVRTDEVVQQAVLTGTVSGIAVALSGGDEDAIQQAFTKGAVTSVIRSSYRELTKKSLEDNLKHAKGAGYCLDAPMGSDLNCAPPDSAYKRDPTGGVITRQVDGKTVPQIDMTKLDYRRPFVGLQTASDSPDALGFSETNGSMELMSRVPGFNAMAVAHDIAMDGMPSIGIGVLDKAVLAGTIAPFVVMTYEGAGYGIHEQIRSVITEGSKRGIETLGIPTRGELQSAVEFQHLHCEAAGQPSLSYFSEVTISITDNAFDGSNYVCRIDQALENGKWNNVWRSEQKESQCPEKINMIIGASLEEGYRCLHNSGIRVTDKRPELATASTGME